LRDVSYGRAAMLRNRTIMEPPKVWPFQVAVAYSPVPANGGGDAAGGGVYPHSYYTWFTTATFPYTVPDSHELRITAVQFGSKYVAGRSSYFILDNVMTLSELGPNIILPESSPFIVPAGRTISARFINNSPEDQNMTGFVLGKVCALTE
jgi:hypothetical protein